MSCSYNMNNKFETKTRKKNSLKSASLIEHFMRTLDRLNDSIIPYGQHRVNNVDLSENNQ